MASLAANVAVVEPTLTGHVIGLAVVRSYCLMELLIRQVRGGSSRQVGCCRCLRRRWQALR